MRRIVTLAAAAALGLAPAAAFAAGDQMAPSAQSPSAQSPSVQAPAAQATVPDATVGKAGGALHDVAQLQQKYQGKMDTATPEQKKGLSEQANAEAVQAIQAHGLSVQEYSQVIRTAQNNPQLKQRLLQAANKGD